MATGVARFDSNNNSGGGGGGGERDSAVADFNSTSLRLAGAAASTKNNFMYKNNGGILVVRQKDKQRSVDADHSKVDVLISRESAVLLLRCFPESSLADMLHLAMMTSLECCARHVLYIMQRPILFSTPETKRKTRAALVNAAELMPFAVELMVKGQGCPVGDISERLLEYIRDDASMDCFETELGGVGVQYRLYGKKGATSRQVVDKTMGEVPEPMTPLEDDGFDHMLVAAPTVSAPMSPSGQADRESTADEVAVEVSGSHNHNSSTPCKPRPFSSSDEEGSSSPPTPPLSPPPASSSMDDSPAPIEPPPLALPLSTPPLLPVVPPPPSPKTFSVNPLGDMFSPPLDKPGVIAVVDDILCSQRVMNDRKKTVRVLAELESGCISGETMEWVVRGLRTVRGKRELVQRHGGLVFVGPQWGAPVYKTQNGIRRLLRGVAKKHGVGTKFVVCFSSSSGNAAENVKMITGIISASASDAPASAQASAPALDTARVEPVMDGDVPGLEGWSNIRGNLDDGCRLWAWVY